MMDDGADEEYDFEFEEDEEGDEADADIENLYYNAKGEVETLAAILRPTTPLTNPLSDESAHLSTQRR